MRSFGEASVEFKIWACVYLWTVYLSSLETDASVPLVAGRLNVRVFNQFALPNLSIRTEGMSEARSLEAKALVPGNRGVEVRQKCISEFLLFFFYAALDRLYRIFHVR